MTVEELKVVTDSLLKMLVNRSEKGLSGPKIGIDAIHLVLFLDGSGEIVHESDFGFRHTFEVFSDLDSLVNILTEQTL